MIVAKNIKLNMISEGGREREREGGRWKATEKSRNKFLQKK